MFASDQEVILDVAQDRGQPLHPDDSLCSNPEATAVEAWHRARVEAEVALDARASAIAETVTVNLPTVRMVDALPPTSMRRLTTARPARLAGAQSGRVETTDAVPTQRMRIPQEDIIEQIYTVYMLLGSTGALWDEVPPTNLREERMKRFTAPLRLMTRPAAGLRVSGAVDTSYQIYVMMGDRGS